MVARRAPAVDRSSSSSTPTAIRRRPAQGRVTADLRAYIEPKQEYKQIFDEAWRNQRDYLYVTNEHGADWPKVKEMYSQFLPYVNHRADLNYLIDMMGAEISIGHSYVRGGDMPDVPAAVPGGLLGADFSIENGRYRITKIYDDEEWNTDLRAPLAAPGVDVRVGDYILAINGQDLKAPDNIYRLLDGTANRQTALVVNSTPAARRRASRHGRSRGERARAAHARMDRRESAHRRFAVARPAGVRLSAQHRGSRGTRASTATTSRSRTRRARSSTSGTMAAARPRTTSSTYCSATSTATSTTSPAIACRSPAPRPASGARR